jgi:UDP-glucose 4-epimerase
MRCCLIGGSGFIGGHLAPLLAVSGRELTVVGRSVTPLRKLPPGAQYVSGNYGDQRLLRKLLAQADEVIDLAYATVPQTSFADPVFDIQANLPPSVSLLRCAGETRLRRIVLISSGGTVYGVAKALPITEEHPTDPISPYGITKLTIEKYGLMFHRLAELPVIIVRPGNAYGPGQLSESGQGFVATAIARVLGGREVTICGQEGTIRDYVHVTDIAKGILSALEYVQLGCCYNIGTEIGKSNRDVLRAIEPLASAHGCRIGLRVDKRRGFDVPANILDSARLREISGWTPQVPFEAGIGETWNHFAGAAGTS